MPTFKSPDGRIALVQQRQGRPPVIELSEDYKMVDSLEGLGVPSLTQGRQINHFGPCSFF